MGSFFPREKTHGETFLTEEGDGVLDAGGGRTGRCDGCVESDPVRVLERGGKQDQSAKRGSKEISPPCGHALAVAKRHALVGIPGRFPSRLSLLCFFE